MKRLLRVLIVAPFLIVGLAVISVFLWLANADDIGEMWEAMLDMIWNGL